MLKRMNLRPWLQSITVVGLLSGASISGSAQEGLPQRVQLAARIHVGADLLVPFLRTYGELKPASAA